MNRAGFYSMLDGLPSVNAFPDYRPEDEELPVVIYSHISNVRGRVQDGGATGFTDTWRVTIVANDREEIDNLLTEVETLDNSSTDDFSKVYILSINDNTQNEGDIFVTTFVDLKTTDR